MLFIKIKWNLIQRRMFRIWLRNVLLGIVFGGFIITGSWFDVFHLYNEWIYSAFIWGGVWMVVLFAMIFPQAHKRASYRTLMMGFYWVVAVGYAMMLYLGLREARFVAFIYILPLALVGSEYYSVRDNVIGNVMLLLTAYGARWLFQPESFSSNDIAAEILPTALYLFVVLFAIYNVDRMTKHRARQEELFRKASATSAELRRANALLSEAYEQLAFRNAEMERLNMLLSEAFDELSQRNAVMEKDLSVASQIQAGLITSVLPNDESIEFVARFVPFDKVGGDFYLVEKNEIGTWIFMTDVSGHGMPAALIAAMCHASLKRYLDDRIASPGKILSLMNNELIPRLAGFYFTAFLGLYRPASRKMTMAIAGHPFPLIITPNQSYRVIESNDPILGLFPDLAPKDRTLSLARRIRMFVFTDGLYECRSPNDTILGEEAVLRFLREHNHDTLERLSDQLIEYIRGFTKDRSFDDDLTFLAMEVK